MVFTNRKTSGQYVGDVAIIAGTIKDTSIGPLQPVCDVGKSESLIAKWLMWTLKRQPNLYVMDGEEND